MFSVLKNIISDIQQLSFLNKIILVILSILSIISISQGIVNSQIYSNDFQWSPTVLLSEGINPYLYFLNNNYGDRVIGSQAPNYLHSLYVILLPFAKLDWIVVKKIWLIINILLTIFTFLMIAKKIQLENITLLFIFLIYLCSIPFRNSLGAGQQSILILFAFAFLFGENRLSYFFSGISYIKYSFAPPIAIYILIKQGAERFLLSLLILFIGFVIFYIMQNETNIYSLFIQPLMVSAKAVGYGVSDYMTIVSIVVSSDSNYLVALYYYIFPVFASLALTIFLVRNTSDVIYELTIISLIGLLFFKHLISDYIFLLPAFLYSIQNIRYFYSKISILCIFYFWFVVRVIYFFDNNYSMLHDYLLLSKVFNFLVLLLILIMVVATKKQHTIS
jgi:hypothetical protein